ncbi:MAG: hypothetical protein LIP16_16790, partial [Clostridium sp.]|nr:hypothetical protein [Clostridium sp.]
MRKEETADIDFDRDYESIRQVPAGPGEEAGREKGRPLSGAMERTLVGSATVGGSRRRDAKGAGTEPRRVRSAGTVPVGTEPGRVRSAGTVPVGTEPGRV